MVDLKAFRKANKLTQQEVATYLGVKKPFICQIETGRNTLPSKHLDNLLSNNEGWDVSSLIDKSCELSSGSETYNKTTENSADFSSQLIEEISAQRQLTEQAQNITEQAHTITERTQEIAARMQDHLTQAQEHLTQTNERLAASQAQVDKTLKQMDRLLVMLEHKYGVITAVPQQPQAQPAPQNQQKPASPQLVKNKTDN